MLAEEDMMSHDKKAAVPAVPAAVAGTPKTIDTMEDLIALVQEVDIGAHERFEDFDKSIWYRGQPDSAYGLQPGALRDAFLRARSFGAEFETVVDHTDFALGFERQFNQAFRRRSATFVPSHTPLVDLYFLMQHHGMPTRLLDWTTNPLAALFFAVSENGTQDGALFVLDPDKLCRSDDKFDGPAQMDHRVVKAAAALLFKQIDFEEFDFGKDRIVPVYPNLVAGRMFQQSSCFTLHLPKGKSTKESTDLEGNPAFRVQKHIIPAAKKKDLQLVLRRMGINYATLYHDLDNLAREMKAELFGSEAMENPLPKFERVE